MTFNEKMVNYELIELSKRLDELYKYSMKPYYEESKFDNFIDNETFEKRKTIICWLASQRTKSREEFKKLLELKYKNS